MVLRRCGSIFSMKVGSLAKWLGASADGALIEQSVSRLRWL